MLAIAIVDIKRHASIDMLVVENALLCNVRVCATGTFPYAQFGDHDASAPAEFVVIAVLSDLPTRASLTHYISSKLYFF